MWAFKKITEQELAEEQEQTQLAAPRPDEWQSYVAEMTQTMEDWWQRSPRAEAVQRLCERTRGRR